jgi:hypothetical protein
VIYLDSFVERFIWESDVQKRCAMVGCMENHVNHLNFLCEQILEDDKPVRNIMQPNYIHERVAKVEKMLIRMDTNHSDAARWMDMWIAFIQEQSSIILTYFKTLRLSKNVKGTGV